LIHVVEIETRRGVNRQIMGRCGQCWVRFLDANGVEIHCFYFKKA
jgi:radical SAM superfamily enzyme with C-terminal helix-hairpin-helix motif